MNKSDFHNRAKRIAQEDPIGHRDRAHRAALMGSIRAREFSEHDVKLGQMVKEQGELQAAADHKYADIVEYLRRRFV